ncbi:MAG: hypothetical protein ACHQ7M_19900, partial [Chloroflexota bacterium]
MAMTETTPKPAYLGLLNAISLAESEAGVYLEAWANATTDEELAGCLRFVAARETSHGELFCRRLDELGYSLRQKPDPKSAGRLARYANPKISDCEKVGPEREESGDAFADIKKAIADGVYADMTCNMLQWYIKVEYDRGRRLNAVNPKVREKAAMTYSMKKATGANGHAADMDA